jgi:hypothetical protein
MRYSRNYAESWESADMPNYTAWSTNLEDSREGIESVRQCLRDVNIVLPLLREIT